MQLPDPALQRNLPGWPEQAQPQQQGGQSWGTLPRTSSPTLFPSNQRKSDGKRRDGQEVSEVCILHPS